MKGTRILHRLLGTPRRTFAVCFLLGFLVACGQAGVVRLDSAEMRFSRTELEVTAQQPVTVTISNKDGFAHSFDIDEYDIHIPLPANQTVSVTFTPDQAGVYDFYCGSTGHRAAGMTGTLIVDP